MANYDWRMFEDTFFGRFPKTANGFNQWKDFRENFSQEEFIFSRRPKPISCPRVFISHKKEDADIARRIAWLATQEKFEFWLDVLDPPLQAFLAQTGQFSPLAEARLIAAIIEMGLINCTHIIAVITEKSRPSRWIPYEYGRVKDSKTLVGTTASWLSKSQMKDLAEYLLLGNISHTELELRNWLHSEYNKKPRDINCTGGGWNGEEPSKVLDNII